MLICPECGSTVKENEEYCQECGCPIGFIVDNQPALTAELLICPECSSKVDESAECCQECGCPIGFIVDNQPAPTEKILICPECSSEVAESDEYCHECGCPIKYIIEHQAQRSNTTVEPDNSDVVQQESVVVPDGTKLICPKCGAEVTSNNRCCPDCGSPIDYILNNQICASEYSASTDLKKLIEGAESGNAEAMYWLGYHYYFDEDEAEAEAEKWWKKAAQLGNQKAKADYESNFKTAVQAPEPVPDKWFPLKKLLARYDSIVVLDTETTGLDSRANRIIELAAVKLVNKNGDLAVADQMDSLIKLPAGTRLDGEITRITGITDQKLATEGVQPSDAFEEFAHMIFDRRVLLVAYNAQFDLGFLYHSLVREGLDYILRQADMLDALTVYKDRRQFPHRLENAISAYNLNGKVTNTHRAIDDVLALVEVLKAMDTECDDVDCYINLFGYNPKYGVSGDRIRSVRYLPQYYNSYKKLYQ